MSSFDPLEVHRRINQTPNPRFSDHQTGRATITILEVPKYSGSNVPVGEFFHYAIDYGTEPAQAYTSSDNRGIQEVSTLLDRIEAEVKAFEPFHGRPHFEVRYYRMQAVREQGKEVIMQDALDTLL